MNNLSAAPAWLRLSFIIIALSAPCLFMANDAHADPAECETALQSYNAAISEVSTALRSYASCVSNSRGHDDCSLEFSTLRSAQDEFESAVQAYQSDCS